MRHNWSTRLLSICAYGLPNISGFGGSAPERVRLAPPLCLKGSPQLLRYFLPEVASLLKQRWSFRQQASTVQEHLRVSHPSTLIAPEPPDPAVIAINQPSLPHGTLSRYISTTFARPVSATGRNTQKRTVRQPKGSSHTHGFGSNAPI